MRLPILSFGIGLCSFVLFSDNVSRNSCIRIWRFCLTLERGGGYFKHSFLSKSHDEGLGTACIYFFTWSLLTCDCSQLTCILFVIGRMLCHITSKMGKTIAKLLCFGSFAGAWAHHEGLRRLIPCHFQRTAYWHCECDKLWPDARFQLLVVCSSWTRGHRANEPCLGRLQLSNMKVSINDGSDWKTFSVLLKHGQWNCLEAGLSRSKKTNTSQDTMRSNSCSLAAWLRLLIKKSYLGSCLTFLGKLCMWVGSRRVVL